MQELAGRPVAAKREATGAMGKAGTKIAIEVA